MEIVQTKKGKHWEVVHIDGYGDFEGLAGIEELRDYEITNADEVVYNEKTKVKKKGKKKKVLKNKKKLEEEPLVEVEQHDIIPWTNIFVPDEIARALAEQGFREPTEIQRQCIPAAIKGRRDLLGAAETGSGKTLAFGIPMLHGILKQLDKGFQSDIESDGEFDFTTNDKCVKIIHCGSEKKVGNLLGLVLAPTRELAMQVKKHIEIAAKYTSVKVAAVVGGMSIEKQIRILKKKPHLLVATPGRLWELITQEPQLANLNNIGFLAIDETDRMLERDHFPELRSILEMLKEQKNQNRQYFVFSATLTLVHEPPSYIKRKKPRKGQLTQSDKLNNLIKVVGMKDYKIVDITKKSVTAETLKEAKISCTHEEKDYFLYYLLKVYNGKTVIFCNSISCVRRLASVLGLLSCKPIPLHANMQQRQRLKNLDKFAREKNSVLLSTDVAARGLDIPGINHVIHYQVPRTSEGYIHRSGRTARASNEGITILLIEPSEIKSYVKICSTLGRVQNPYELYYWNVTTTPTKKMMLKLMKLVVCKLKSMASHLIELLSHLKKDLDEFPVDHKLLCETKVRVKVAREIDIIQRKLSKAKSNSSWIEKSVAEMDIILDNDDEMKGKLDKREMSMANNILLNKKKHLNQLLSKPFIYKGLEINAVSVNKKRNVKKIKLLKQKKLSNKTE